MTKERLIEVSTYMRDETAAFMQRLQGEVAAGTLEAGAVPKRVQQQLAALATRMEQDFDAPTERLAAAQSVHGADEDVRVATQEVRNLVT